MKTATPSDWLQSLSFNHTLVLTMKPHCPPVNSICKPRDTCSFSLVQTIYSRETHCTIKDQIDAYGSHGRQNSGQPWQVESRAALAGRI